MPPSSPPALLPTPSPGPALEDLDEARALVAGELAACDARLEALLADVEVEAVGRAVAQLFAVRGKRLRPLVALLSARACGAGAEAARAFAVAAELIHGASLLHDDVVDQGGRRRGRPTARLVCGNGVAVLAGDWCLARALAEVARSELPAAVSRLAEAMAAMAAAEVEQLARAGDPAVGADACLEVARGKTAALFAWAAAAPALAGPRPALAETLWAFGEALGLAFQVVDDCLDLAGDPAATGKPRGRDLAEGKVTLPVVMAAEADPRVAAEVARLMAAGHVDPASWATLAAAVTAAGGVRAARAEARRHAGRAVRALAPLPAGPAREALTGLAWALCERER